jgi:hypothetical protein
MTVLSRWANEHERDRVVSDLEVRDMWWTLEQGELLRHVALQSPAAVAHYRIAIIADEFNGTERRWVATRWPFFSRSLPATRLLGAIGLVGKRRARP